MERKVPISDETISRNVTRQLSHSGLRAPCHIQVQTRNGEVTLSGTVQFVHQRNAAMQAIRTVEGVTRVVEKLKVTPPPKREYKQATAAASEAPVADEPQAVRHDGDAERHSPPAPASEIEPFSAQTVVVSPSANTDLAFGAILTTTGADAGQHSPPVPAGGKTEADAVQHPPPAPARKEPSTAQTKLAAAPSTSDDSVFDAILTDIVADAGQRSPLASARRKEPSPAQKQVAASPSSGADVEFETTSTKTDTSHQVRAAAPSGAMTEMRFTRSGDSYTFECATAEDGERLRGLLVGFADWLKKNAWIGNPKRTGDHYVVTFHVKSVIEFLRQQGF